MGIPKFYTRMHAYGANEIIGRSRTARQSQSQSTVAVVDGPSLAHFLYDELIKEGNADEKIQCFYRYATIGRRAIKWLDNLRSFGFEIKAIYFDGALPASKKQTRLDRLRKQAESLPEYKQRLSVKRQDRETLRKARNNVPPPPFLVSAVIEALSQSVYADKTWVVDGEADSVCAALAYETSHKFAKANSEYSISIFTNDSDLLIWSTGNNTRIVIIREMRERQIQEEAVIEAFCFWPRILARFGDRQLPDLVKPAYKMRDPRVTFAQAINNPGVTASDEAFIRFAAQYSIAYPLAKLMLQRQHRSSGMELRPQEPRISEIVRQYTSGLLRNPAIAASIGCVESTERAEPSTSNVSGGELERAWNLAEIEQEPVDPFQGGSDQLAETHNLSKARPTMTLDMFLPPLLQYPEQSTAWTIGVALRNVAYTLLMLPLRSREAMTQEYRRSGSNIAPRTAKPISLDVVHESITALTSYCHKALDITNSLRLRQQWRFLVMHLTLSDMDRAEMEQPETADLVKVVNGTATSEWDHIHLFAQYQAQYYSLKMVKEVWSFCQNREEFHNLNLSQSLTDLGNILNEMPAIAVFFATNDLHFGAENWEVLSEQFVESFD